MPATRAARPRISQHEALRRQRGLLTTQVARALGLSHAYVSMVEAGQKAASPRYRTAFSGLIGVDEEIVFDASGWVR